jgi:hypothetical protein
LPEVLACFDADTIDDWTLASVLTTPQEALGGRSIVEHLRARLPLEPVLELARVASARLAR